jgi:hypothetical protein
LTIAPEPSVARASAVLAQCHHASPLSHSRSSSCFPLTYA